MMNQLASRYTKALLQLSADKGILQHVYQDMMYFAQVCNANSSLLEVLKNPIIEQARKLSVIRSIFQSKIHDLTLSFFAMIVRKRRESLFPAVYAVFLTQYYWYQDIKNAQVTTVLPLSDEQAVQMQEIAQKIVPCKKVLLQQHIDSTLIGGYIMQVEGKQLDHSLRKKFFKLKRKYMTEVY